MTCHAKLHLNPCLKYVFKMTEFCRLLKNSQNFRNYCSILLKEFLHRKEEHLPFQFLLKIMYSIFPHFQVFHNFYKFAEIFLLPNILNRLLFHCSHICVSYHNELHVNGISHPIKIWSFKMAHSNCRIKQNTKEKMLNSCS